MGGGVVYLTYDLNQITSFLSNHKTIGITFNKLYATIMSTIHYYIFASQEFSICLPSSTPCSQILNYEITAKAAKGEDEGRQIKNPWLAKMTALNYPR